MQYIPFILGIIGGIVASTTAFVIHGNLCNEECPMWWVRHTAGGSWTVHRYSSLIEELFNEHVFSDQITEYELANVTLRFDLMTLTENGKSYDLLKR